MICYIRYKIRLNRFQVVYFRQSYFNNFVSFVHVMFRHICNNYCRGESLSINYEQFAQKHQVSVSAVQHLAQAIARGNGTQAQFNHPDLGGMGQWMPTMLMIGDAFNYALKAKVDVLCHELARSYQDGEIPTAAKISIMNQMQWWSYDFGNPTLIGGQNDIRYVYFAQRDRLIIQRNSKEYLYDTAPYSLTGVSQQQANNTTVLVFHTQDNKSLNTSDFKAVDS